MNIQHNPVKTKYVNKIAEVDKQLCGLNKNMRATRELLTQLRTNFKEDEFYLMLCNERQTLKNLKQLYLQFVSELSLSSVSL